MDRRDGEEPRRTDHLACVIHRDRHDRRGRLDPRRLHHRCGRATIRLLLYQPRDSILYPGDTATSGDGPGCMIIADGAVASRGQDAREGRDVRAGHDSTGGGRSDGTQRDRGTAIIFRRRHGQFAPIAGISCGGHFPAGVVAALSHRISIVTVCVLSPISTPQTSNPHRSAGGGRIMLDASRYPSRHFTYIRSSPDIVCGAYASNGFSNLPVAVCRTCLIKRSPARISI